MQIDEDMLCYRGGEGEIGSRDPGAWCAFLRCSKSLASSDWGEHTLLHACSSAVSLVLPALAISSTLRSLLELLRQKYCLQVPLPLSRVVPGQTVAGNSVPVHFIGICAAASSVGRRISSQVLKCPCCDTVQTVLAGVPRQACCEESSSLSCAQWEEDMSGRTFVPVWPSCNAC